MAVSSAEDWEDAIGQANGTPYGLGAGVLTSDISGAVRAIREIDAGNVHINWTIGKEGPRSAVAEMTDTKTVIRHGQPW